MLKLANLKQNIVRIVRGIEEKMRRMLYLIYMRNSVRYKRAGIGPLLVSACCVFDFLQA